MKTLTAIIAASLLVSSVNVMAEAYLGGKIGKSWYEDSCRAGDACDKDGSTIGLFGGYNFNDYIAIESGYDYLGRVSGAGISDESTSAITLAPKFTLPLTEVVSVYGKIGGAYVDYGHEDDMSYLGAAGLEFNVDPNASIRVEYQRLTDINNDVVKAKNNTATLGFVYKFGGSAESAPEPAPVVEPVFEPAEPVDPAPAPKPIHTYKKQLSSSSSFALNSAELTSNAKSELQEVIEVMNKYPQSNVTIIGHTDSTGTEQYNMQLSEKRAKAVASYIESRGVEDSRVTTRAMGETQPIATNKTREGRQKNRRVDIEVPVFEYQIQVK